MRGWSPSAPGRKSWPLRVAEAAAAKRSAPRPDSPRCGALYETGRSRTACGTPVRSSFTWTPYGVPSEFADRRRGALPTRGGSCGRRGPWRQRLRSAYRRTRRPLQRALRSGALQVACGIPFAEGRSLRHGTARRRHSLVDGAGRFRPAPEAVAATSRWRQRLRSAYRGALRRRTRRHCGARYEARRSKRLCESHGKASPTWTQYDAPSAFAGRRRRALPARGGN